VPGMLVFGTATLLTAGGIIATTCDATHLPVATAVTHARHSLSIVLLTTTWVRKDGCMDVMNRGLLVLFTCQGMAT
jgi:hypothetical protein